MSKVQKSRFPSFVFLLIVGGAALGPDTMPEAAASRDVWLALLGTGAGAVLILSHVGGLTAAVPRPWQRIAMRVAGSWTAASAVCVHSTAGGHA